ncbi:MAG: hypothetical protein IJ085_04855, partial [Turicibacter sp.]|nr:hypothetical protein [Turicibacter sp.]
MPNRLIYNGNPETVKTQIYGSDLNTPVEVLDGAVSVTGILSLDTSIALSVNVTSLPEVTIASLPAVEL